MRLLLKDNKSVGVGKVKVKSSVFIAPSFLLITFSLNTVMNLPCVFRFCSGGAREAVRKGEGAVSFVSEL